MAKVAVLYSGGLDSYVLMKYAESQGHDVSAWYWKHGQPSEYVEVNSLPSGVQVRTVDWLGKGLDPVQKGDDPRSIFIPGRNLVFATLTACQTLADEIWIGAQEEDNNRGSTDKNQIFMKGSSQLLTYVLNPFRGEVKVRAPFQELHWTKLKTIDWALKNKITPEQLIKTVSCYYPATRYGDDDYWACGDCSNCLKRFILFSYFGFDEKFHLRRNPLLKRTNNEGYAWLIKMMSTIVKDGWHPQEEEISCWEFFRDSVNLNADGLSKELITLANLVPRFKGVGSCPESELQLQE